MVGSWLILMHGREEWVLVQLGSRHKCIERPGWLMVGSWLMVKITGSKAILLVHSNSTFLYKVVTSGIRSLSSNSNLL